jgi:hypothetical protein
VRKMANMGAIPDQGAKLLTERSRARKGRRRMPGDERGTGRREEGSEGLPALDYHLWSGLFVNQR